MQLDGDPDSVTIDIHPSVDTSNVRIVTVGNGNSLRIGAGCRIAGLFFLSSGAGLTFGARVKTIGRILCHQHEGADVEIGDDCLFAAEVSFRPSDVHKIIDMNSGKRLNHAKPIVIGRSVWAGEGALFLKGARVGDGSIVGARSVVTKSFPDPNCLLTGHPAQVFRTGVRWEP